MSLQTLEHTKRTLQDLNIIANNTEFCEYWLVKDASYLRVLRFHNKEPSAEALAICASKLGYYAYHLKKSQNLQHTGMAETFDDLRRQCLDDLEQQSRRKWMTPKGMGL